MNLKKMPLFPLLILGFILLSCQDHQNTSITLKATLDGKTVKPLAIPTAATGLFTGKLDLTTNILAYSLSYTDLSAPSVVAHLHQASGVNGTGLVDIIIATGSNTSGSITGTTFPLRQAQVDSLVAGFYYVDLHTVAYPAGEIRGEVIKQ
ncbi:CHRD domain-containing protein [Larkinella knui]|uniref:CHRD domain-containing protein n=1 Tax=Larkinella knui TaxID=2025310 RepID=A0A3P1CKQ3_9BACT|nr:CHRD domain-containing protein [Larkinella knui]RRB13865.1 CHRD domain-containing protein [Larkinella knui]